MLFMKNMIHTVWVMHWILVGCASGRCLTAWCSQMFIDWFCMIESNQLVESNPIANSFIRDDVLSHNKKLIKSDCINITLCTTGHFPTISSFSSGKIPQCKNLPVSLFSTLKNQYQGLMKNVIDRPCHQGSFQNLNLTLNDLKKWPTVSPSTTWVNTWISQNCKNFLQPTQSLCWISKNLWALPAHDCCRFWSSPAEMSDMVFVCIWVKHVLKILKIRIWTWL